MKEPQFRKCYPEGGNVRESNSTATPSGMKLETVTLLIETAREPAGIGSNPPYSQQQILGAKLFAQRICEIEGIKYE